MRSHGDCARRAREWCAERPVRGWPAPSPSLRDCRRSGRRQRRCRSAGSRRLRPSGPPLRGGRSSTSASVARCAMSPHPCATPCGASASNARRGSLFAAHVPSRARSRVPGKSEFARHVGSLATRAHVQGSRGGWWSAAPAPRPACEANKEPRPDHQAQAAKRWRRMRHRPERQGCRLRVDRRAVHPVGDGAGQPRMPALALCASARDPVHPPHVRRCAPAAITMPKPASSDTAEVPP